MNILICVYFKATFGGLHANVYSTAQHAVRQGHNVTIVCRDGPFRAQLEAAGIETIATDYASTDETVQAVLAQSTRRYDIIHTHPFASSLVALELAQRLALPVVATYHGMYPDEIEARVERYAAVVAVSAGIRDYLADRVPKHRHKLFVATNGVDLALFKPTPSTSPAPAALDPRKPRITLVSRLDHDKRFILDLVLRALRHCASAHRGEVSWSIVGDGNEMASLRREVTTIADDGLFDVTYPGWLQGEALADAYRQSDLVIAPGRCALEAMACGRAVIAIGSKEYVGLVTATNWQTGMYTNFGGLGRGLETYQEGRIEAELSMSLMEPELRATLGALGVDLTHQFYDERGINSQLLALYGACATDARRGLSLG